MEAETSVDGAGLVASVAARLRQAITSGVLKPGERLVEARLARDLQISRAPIREAARLLESEGLIISISGRGFFVRQITLRELEEIFDLRLCIERHATATVARQPAARVRRQIEEALAHLLTLVGQGETEAMVEADFNLHRCIVVAAGNRKLLKLFDSAAQDLKLVLRLMGEAAADWSGLANSHQPVIDAILAGRPEDAAQAMEAHIRLSWEDTMLQLRNSSDAPIPQLAVVFRQVI